MDTEGLSRIKISRKPLPRYARIQHGPAEEISNSNENDSFILKNINSVNQYEVHSGYLEDNAFGRKTIASPEITRESDENKQDFNATKHTSYGRGRRSISWVHPLVLVLFGITFLIIVATCIVLAKLSRVNNGFSVSTHTSPYAWKFGPTLVFTILIALWRQVDLHTRLSQPWLEMSSSKSSAQKSLLLDYISPILPAAFWQSLRNKHWRVVTGMTIFIVLKIAVAFSTGFLIINTASSTVTGVTIALQKPHSLGQLTRSMETLEPYQYYANEVYGNMVQNLSYPAGVSSSAAYQILAPSNQFPPNATIFADVLAAFPDLNCENVSLSFSWRQDTSVTQTWPDQPPTVHNDSYLDVNYTSKHCSGQLLSVRDLQFGQGCNITRGTGCQPKTWYLSNTLRIPCSPFEIKSPQNDVWNSFLFVLAAITPASKQGGSILKWTSAAVCQPAYSVQRARLTTDSNHMDDSWSNKLSNLANLTGTMFPSYLATDLTVDIGNILSKVYALGSDLALAPSGSYVGDRNDSVIIERLDSYFAYFLIEIGATDVEAFRDYSVFVDAARKVINRFSAHLLAYPLSLQDTPDTQGSYDFPQRKLFVLDSTAWTLGGIMTIAAILAFALAVTGISSRGIHIPRTLSQISTYVASRDRIFTLLSSMGHVNDKHLLNKFSGHRFSTKAVSPHRSQIQVVTPHAAPHEQDLGHNPNIGQYWVPLSARKWFLAISVVIPLVEIVVLEVLQRQSDMHDGFSDIHTSLYVSQNLVSFIPAVIMLSTAALFSAAEWSINMFAPFSLVSKHPATLRRIDKNTAEGLAPIAILRALISRQYGVSLIVTSTIMGSFLTIVSSGLFTLQTFPKQMNVIAVTTSQFNTSRYMSTEYTADSLFVLIGLHNASYPAGTYMDFAYPFLQLQGTSLEVEKAMTTSAFIDIHVPVLRGRLNCSEPPAVDMSYKISMATTQPTNQTFPMTNLTVVTNLPTECQHSSRLYQNVSRLTTGTSLYMSDVLPGNTSAAQIEMVYGFGSRSQIPGRMWPDYCPSIAFTIGNFGNNTRIDDKTVLICTQLQEEVPAILRFSLPSYKLDLSRPPQLDESKAKVVSGYQYEFDNVWGSGTEQPKDPRASTSDLYYQYMVKTTNVSIDSMVGKQNKDRFYNQTATQYKLYMAQMFGHAARVKSNRSERIDPSMKTLTLDTQLNGTIYDLNRLRVVQHSTSKIILQAILAAMTVCGIAAWSLTNVTRTLPHNPCSIAGLLTLLIGGQFAEECANIAQECDDDEEPGRRLQDREIRLRWWDDEKDTPRRFGLDFASVED